MAKLLKEPDESEDEWLAYVFVSDESRLADFLSTDAELLELREHLGLPELERLDTICGIAVALRSKQGNQTVQ